MWSASAELGLRCPLFLYWSLIPHAGQCVMPMACARASTCFLNCLCSRVLVLLTVFPLLLFVRGLFVVLVLGGGASQRQRDERLHRLTLFSVLSFFLSFFFLFSFLWNGGWRVVRAQLCEHARNTPHALCVSGFVHLTYCVLLLPQRSVCCSHHTLFVVNDHHAHH